MPKSNPTPTRPTRPSPSIVRKGGNSMPTYQGPKPPPPSPKK